MAHQPGPVAIPTRAQKIDRFGVLDAKYRLWKAEEPEYEALKEEIKGWYANFPAGQAVSEDGARYKVILTPCPNVSTPDIPKLIKKFGQAGFRKLVVVYKTAVKKALEAMKEPADEETVDSYFETSRTGSRRISVILRAPEDAA